MLNTPKGIGKGLRYTSYIGDMYYKGQKTQKITRFVQSEGDLIKVQVAQLFVVNHF